MLRNRDKSDIFAKVEWYAVKIAGTVFFLVFVGVEIAHAIAHMLAR